MEDKIKELLKYPNKFRRSDRWALTLEAIMRAMTKKKNKTVRLMHIRQSVLEFAFKEKWVNRVLIDFSNAMDELILLTNKHPEIYKGRVLRVAHGVFKFEEIKEEKPVEKKRDSSLKEMEESILERQFYAKNELMKLEADTFKIAEELRISFKSLMQKNRQIEVQYEQMKDRARSMMAELQKEFLRCKDGLERLSTTSEILAGMIESGAKKYRKGAELLITENMKESLRKTYVECPYCGEKKGVWVKGRKVFKCTGCKKVWMANKKSETIIRECHECGNNFEVNPEERDIKNAQLYCDDCKKKKGINIEESKIVHGD